MISRSWWVSRPSSASAPRVSSVSAAEPLGQELEGLGRVPGGDLGRVPLAAEVGRAQLEPGPLRRACRGRARRAPAPRTPPPSSRWRVSASSGPRRTCSALGGIDPAGEPGQVHLGLEEGLGARGLPRRRRRRSPPAAAPPRRRPPRRRTRRARALRAGSGSRRRRRPPRRRPRRPRSAACRRRRSPAGRPRRGARRPCRRRPGRLPRPRARPPPPAARRPAPRAARPPPAAGPAPPAGPPRPRRRPRAGRGWTASATSSEASPPPARPPPTAPGGSHDLARDGHEAGPVAVGAPQPLRRPEVADDDHRAQQVLEEGRVRRADQLPGLPDHRVVLGDVDLGPPVQPLERQERRLAAPLLPAARRRLEGPTWPSRGARRRPTGAARRAPPRPPARGRAAPRAGRRPSPRRRPGARLARGGEDRLHPVTVAGALGLQLFERGQARATPGERDPRRLGRLDGAPARRGGGLGAGAEVGQRALEADAPARSRRRAGPRPRRGPWRAGGTRPPPRRAPRPGARAAAPAPRSAPRGPRGSGPARCAGRPARPARAGAARRPPAPRAARARTCSSPSSSAAARPRSALELLPQRAEQRLLGHSLVGQRRQPRGERRGLLGEPPDLRRPAPARRAAARPPA